MNLSFANKNPFSTFDFLGYFFPGALFVSMVYLLTGGMDQEGIHNESIPPAIIFLKSFVLSHIGVGIFLMILLSYIIGHLLAYASSITVELFYTWYYGYPTRYLLRKTSEKAEEFYLLNSKLGWFGMWGHLVVCLLLFPIVTGHLVFERLFHMKLFIGRSLDDKLIDSINTKVRRICESLGYADASPFDADVHRIVMHYVYEHCHMHQVKFDNYVALYGLLRSVSLTFCFSFIFMLTRMFLYQDISDEKPVNYLIYFSTLCIVILIIFILLGSLLAKSDWKWLKKKKIDSLIISYSDISLFIIVILISIISFITVTTVYTGKVGEMLQFCGMFLATYVSYLGFAKFYRRFTLENYMALLICEEAKPNDSSIKIKTDEPLNISIDHPTNFLSEVIRLCVLKGK